MVFTIEPGLYFQPDDLSVPEEFRGIGVRIEDDVLVTADGCENLSAGIPRTAPKWKRWLRELAKLLAGARLAGARCDLHLALALARLPQLLLDLACEPSSPP